MSFSSDRRWKQSLFFCLWTIFTPTDLSQLSVCPTRVRLTPPWRRIHRASLPLTTRGRTRAWPRETMKSERRRNSLVERRPDRVNRASQSYSQHWSMCFLGQPRHADFCSIWPEHDDSGYRFGFRHPSGWGNPTLHTKRRDGPLSSDRISKHWRGLTDPAGDWSWRHRGVRWRPTERIISGILLFSRMLAIL